MLDVWEQWSWATFLAVPAVSVGAKENVLVHLGPGQGACAGCPPTSTYLENDKCILFDNV